jgi:hypothetical protein
LNIFIGFKLARLGIFGALDQLSPEHPETPESITAAAISHAVEARIGQASFASSSEKRRIRRPTTSMSHGSEPEYTPSSLRIVELIDSLHAQESQ